MRTQALSGRWESICKYLSFYTVSNPVVIFGRTPQLAALLSIPDQVEKRSASLPSLGGLAFVNLAPGWAAHKNLPWPGAIDGRKGINRPALMVAQTTNQIGKPYMRRKVGLPFIWTLVSPSTLRKDRTASCSAVLSQFKLTFTFLLLLSSPSQTPLSPS